MICIAGKNSISIDIIDFLNKELLISYKDICIIPNKTDIGEDLWQPSLRKYALEKNQGPYGARSKAIELAKTEWYCQLDADDILPSNHCSQN